MEDAGLLKKIDIFHDLNSHEIARIGKLLKERGFKKGEFVVREGDKGDSFFVVKEGTVRISKTDYEENEELIALLGEGEHLGEISLLDRQPRSANVIANEDCALLEMSGEDLENTLSHDSVMAAKIYRGMAKSLCARLREANDNLILLRNYKE